MDIEKFTERARGFIQAAQTIAIREFHQQLAPEHLLKALLDDEEGAAAGLIRAAGGDDKTARAAVEAIEAMRCGTLDVAPLQSYFNGSF